MNSTTTALSTEFTKTLFSLDTISHFVLLHGPNLIYALFILILGRYVAKFFKKIVSQMMQHAHYDHTVNTFISQIIYYGLMALVLLSAINKIGIPTSSFIAVFGAFGLAVGLAMQSNLSNFASGILILIFKPFKAGDWVTIDTIEGKIKGIQLMNTSIITKDNKMIFIPNSHITSSPVTNSTYLDERYIPLCLDISYDNDHHQAIQVIKDVLHQNKTVLNANTVEIGIREFGDNAVRIVAYPRVKGCDFLSTKYALLSAIKDAFDTHGIDIPYPQRVVHLQRDEKSSS